jgi:hypothetical protein
VTHCVTVHSQLAAKQRGGKLWGDVQDAGIDSGMSGLWACIQGHVSCGNQAARKVVLFAMS